MYQARDSIAVLSSPSGLNVLRPIDTSSDTPASRFSTAWWVFVALAATLLPLMVLASFDFGVTWDEKPRHHYGELVWEFLRGLRARNTTYVEDGGHLYGGLFDTICAAVERYVPVNRYVLRHAINATFGWIGSRLRRPPGRAALRTMGGRARPAAGRCFTSVFRRFDEQPEGPAVRGGDSGGALLLFHDVAEMAVSVAVDGHQDRSGAGGGA